MIRFKCMNCKQVLAAKEEQAGTKQLCPNCKNEIQIPALNEGAHNVSNKQLNELTICPTCQNELKTSMFTSNTLLPETYVAVINEYHDEKAQYRCNKCGDSLFHKYLPMLNSERQALTLDLQRALDSIPIATTHSPVNWDYSIVDIVTAQSVTGTGVFSELFSSVTDFFGMLSNTYASKICSGEDLCKKLLRKKTFDLGANAVIAADIDYASVGGDKGMLMVCLSGTAVRLKNVEVLGESFLENLKRLGRVKTRLEQLPKFDRKFV